MKIFEPIGYSSSVNFVDEDNVFLGFDTGQCCCEHYGWFIADQIHQSILEDIPDPEDMDGWLFDKDFFQEAETDTYQFDAGGMVIFRLVKGDAERFLHLFNAHNGYYGHGFNFKIGDKVVKEGVL